MTPEIEQSIVELEQSLLMDALRKRNPMLADAVEQANGKAAPSGGSEPAVIYLYGHINSFTFGDYGANLGVLKDFLDENAAAVNDVLMRINSLGGQASAGVAMMNLIRDYPHKVTAQVDGVCASAATLPFLAADERLMGEATEFMIHQPSMMVAGGFVDMEKASQYLKKMSKMYAKLYTERSDLDNGEVTKAMEAETYYTADEAVEAGFASGIAEGKSPVISADDDDEEDPVIVVVDSEMSGCDILVEDEQIIRDFELNRIRKTLYGGL